MSAKFKASLVECIRHFTPSWFTVIMGTGIVSILWHNFPYGYGSETMKVFAYIFFFLNLSAFILFNILTALRYIWWPKIWLAVIHHSTQSLFLGTYPMGLSTLINVAVAVIYVQSGFGGKGFLYTLWGIWWFNVALSALSALGIVHIMFTRQKHTLESVTATWLLPVVPLIVIASSGAILAAPLLKFSQNDSLLTLVFSTVLIVCGLALAFMMLTVYFLRLVLHGIPRSAGVVSVYIPLGPLGQGGYGVLLLGSGYRAIFPLHYGNSIVLHEEIVGQVIGIAALVIALVLWAMATLFLIYAVIGTIDVLWHDEVPFKQAFWSLIFPNGLYANLTIQLFWATDSPFFRVWGAIYAAVTLALWTWVFVKTLALVYDGSMFRAPILDDVDIHAAAIEKDAKARHAGCPLENHVEVVAGPDGFLQVRHRPSSLSSDRRPIV